MPGIILTCRGVLYLPNFFQASILPGLRLLRRLAARIFLIYPFWPSKQTKMIFKHAVLTLIVGTGIAVVGWHLRPAVWTPMPIVGVCLIVTGFVLWSIARFQLGDSFAVTAQARHLVTHGLYSKFRNPIYVFGSFVIAGEILFVERPTLLLFFVVLIPIQIWRAGKESKVLEEKFGDEYRKYRAQTWF